MTIDSNPTQTIRVQTVLRTGAAVGLAGGLAEIVVVWLHAAWTGGDAALVARQVSIAARLGDGSAWAGAALHMVLALALGIVLAAIWQRLADRSWHDGWVFPVMLSSLAAVWGINFFIVLPIVSPGFVHLLPLGVTLASKLAFGLAAAAMLRICAASRTAPRAVLTAVQVA